MTLKNKKIGIIALIAITSITIPTVAAVHIPFDVENYCDNITISNHVHKFEFMCDFAVDHEQRLDALEAITPSIPIIYTVNATEDNAGGDKIVIAYCDSGDVVTGGGFGVIRTTSPSLFFFNPTITQPMSDLSGWKTEWAAGTITGYNFTTHATCLDITP